MVSLAPVDVGWFRRAARRRCQPSGRQAVLAEAERLCASTPRILRLEGLRVRWPRRRGSPGPMVERAVMRSVSRNVDLEVPDTSSIGEVYGAAVRAGIACPGRGRAFLVHYAMTLRTWFTCAGSCVCRAPGRNRRCTAQRWEKLCTTACRALLRRTRSKYGSRSRSSLSFESSMARHATGRQT